MIKKSRYQNSVPFKNENNRDPLFLGLRPRPIGQTTAILEYKIKKGDRLDLLSLYFYNNDQKWWRILDANSWIVFGADLSLDSCINETLLIPALTEPGGNP